MARILVSGLINIETTLRIEGFPYEYRPVRFPFFGINSTVSGVGYNIAKALTTLGDKVSLLSLIGNDVAAENVRAALKTAQVSDRYVLSQLAQTAQSVILFDPGGTRAINSDLKDIQDQQYPQEEFEDALEGSAFAVLCNINFSRRLLPLARRAGVPIATDVHAVSQLHDAYNADFMAAAHVLFMSHELLPTSPEAWVRDVWSRYDPEILVIGMGGEGALLAVRRDNFIERIPAVQTRAIVNTIGAGDSLFSAFLHSYAESRDPYTAIKKAVLFASWKIGAAGAADGFLTAAELDELYQTTPR
jgi:acarbose 7IV-phosphotransferase